MQAQESRESQYVFLAGQPSARTFVRYIKSVAVDGAALDDTVLIRRWQEARSRLQKLAMTETQVAEIPALTALPAEIAAEAERELQDPALIRAYGILPYRWAMVELDRLIPWQRYVDLRHAEKIRSSLPESPTLQELLQFVSGRTQEPPPVQVSVRDGNNFVFSSPSNDLRVLGAVPLSPANIQGYDPQGRPMTVLGVYVGYSLNVMSAVYMTNRLVLVNGTHRAYALRSHGLTHAPCIVRSASSSEDLDLIAQANGGNSVEQYLRMPRPPLLKDFFDPTLTENVRARQRTHAIQLEMKFVQTAIPTG